MKSAVVTGGSRGIGLAIVKQLQEDGCTVSVIDMAKPEVAAQTMEKGNVHFDSLYYYCGDITSAADRTAFFAEVVRRNGRIDILVNNAGVAPKVRADLLDMTEDSFDRVVGINVKGNLFVSQCAAKQMISQEPAGNRRGVIVNISSCSAYASSVNRGEYCVSKAGVSMLTRLFADRLSAEGINVFEVRPGIIATDMTAAVTEKYDRMIADGLLPIARFGRPEDVAGAVSMLCSDRLCYCTGDVINADGGFHLRRL